MLPRLSPFARERAGSRDARLNTVGAAERTRSAGPATATTTTAEKMRRPILCTLPIKPPALALHFGDHPEVAASPGKTLSPNVEPAVRRSARDGIDRGHAGPETRWGS